MLRQVVEPYLRDLVHEFDEGAGLSVQDGDENLYVLHLASEGPVRTEDWTGQSFPCHTVAGGMAVLATWSDERIKEYAARGLRALSPNTITTADALCRRVKEIRSAGYARTVGEFSPDINGFGAAITSHSGTVFGAINVYGPAFRFPGDRDPDEIGDRLIEVAATISRRLST